MKQSTVAVAGDDRKEPAYLILGEKGNCGQWWGVLAGLHRSDSIAVLSDFAQRACDHDRRILLVDRGRGLSYCRIGAARFRPPQAGRGTESPDTTCGTWPPIRRSTRACASAAGDAHPADSTAFAAS